MMLKYYTAAEICETLSISRTRFDHYKKQGRVIPYIKIGRICRYDLDQVRRDLGIEQPAEFKGTTVGVSYAAHGTLICQSQRATLDEAVIDAVRTSFMHTDDLPACGYIEVVRSEVIRIPNSQWTGEETSMVSAENVIPVSTTFSDPKPELFTMHANTNVSPELKKMLNYCTKHTTCFG